MQQPTDAEVKAVVRAIIMAQPAHRARNWLHNPIFEEELLAGMILARAAIAALDKARNNE